MSTIRNRGRHVFPEQIFGNTDESEHVTVTISAAEVVLLSAAPIEIIPAPGAGKANIIERALLFLDHGGTDYDNIAAGEDLSFRYTDENGTQIMQVEATGFLDASADALRYAYPTVDLSGHALVLVPTANAAVVLNMLTGNIATGNSPLVVRAYYRIIPTTLP